MALTDTRPETGTRAPTVARHARSRGPSNLLGTGDHKAIGVAYVVIALVFGVVGWIAHRALRAPTSSATRTS